jgi:hypothetical protein
LQRDSRTESALKTETAIELKLCNRRQQNREIGPNKSFSLYTYVFPLTCHANLEAIDLKEQKCDPIKHQRILLCTGALSLSSKFKSEKKCIF